MLNGGVRRVAYRLVVGSREAIQGRAYLACVWRRNDPVRDRRKAYPRWVLSADYRKPVGLRPWEAC